MVRRRGFTLALALGVVVSATAAGAQVLPTPRAASATGPNALDSLVALALARSPSVLAALERVEAARAKTGAAGALPDPMLELGIMNVPIRDPGFGDFMTMTTVGVGQTLPYPGKLALERDAAALEVRAAEARLEATRLEVTAMVRSAYFDLALIDRSLEALENNRTLLSTLAQVATSRYAAGSGGQEEVLEVRADLAALAAEASTLTEARRAALGGLNALLDRPSETPVADPRIPDGLARAAVASTQERIRFTSVALGARVADSPLQPLADLQQRAIDRSPVLRAHEAEISAQAARVELSRRAHLPDFDLTLQYGQRVGNADMVSVTVAVPIPAHRSARQDQGVAEAGAELAALEAEHDAMVNDLRAEVARLHAEVERARSQLGLLAVSIVPQGRAALESTSAAFMIGDADLAMVIERQAALYEYEVAHHRALTDFAKALAELGRTVGEEVVR